MRSFPSAPPRSATCLVGLFLLGGSARGETTFAPELSVGWGHTDNVNYTESAPTESESYRRYRAVLPLVTTRPRSSFSFSYRPTYLQYEQYEDLDDLEHMAEFIATATVSQRSRIKFRTDYQDTQSQDYPLAGEGAQPALLYYRTERQVLGTFLNLDRDIGRAWVGHGSVAWQNVEIDDISGYQSAIPVDELGDRQRTNVSLGADREMARGRRLGLQYGFDDYKVDNREDESIHRLRVRTDHALSRVLTYGVSAGGSYRTDREDYTAEGTLDMLRTFQAGQLTLGASHGVVNAGVVPGGNVSTGVRAEFAAEAGRRWGWSLSSRFVRRASDDVGDPDIDNLRGGMSLRYRGPDLGRNGALGFRMSGYAVDQRSTDDPTLDASYLTFSVDMVAYLGKQGS